MSLCYVVLWILTNKQRLGTTDTGIRCHSVTDPGPAVGVCFLLRTQISE